MRIRNKDPAYKYQNSPFTNPKNKFEKSYDNFLEKIKDNANAKQQNSLRSKPVIEDTKHFQTIDSAFDPIKSQQQSMNYYFETYFVWCSLLKKNTSILNVLDVKNSEINHDRAIKNWAKVKAIMNFTVGALMKLKSQRVKQQQPEDILSFEENKRLQDIKHMAKV